MSQGVWSGDSELAKVIDFELLPKPLDPSQPASLTFKEEGGKDRGFWLSPAVARKLALGLRAYLRSDEDPSKTASPSSS